MSLQSRLNPLHRFNVHVSPKLMGKQMSDDQEFAQSEPLCRLKTIFPGRILACWTGGNMLCCQYLNLNFPE